MVSYGKGGTQAKGISKHDPEANIFDKREENEEFRMIHKEELHS